MQSRFINYSPAIALIFGLAGSLPALAEPLTLDAAIAKAQATDPRIAERQAKVKHAKALLQEAEGATGWIIDLTSALALATKVEGGLFEEGAPASNATLRDDVFDVDGVVPFASLQGGLLKPLLTFGKAKNYREAARNNILIQEQEVPLQRGLTALDVTKAYYGLLASRAAVALLEEAGGQLKGALVTAEELFEDEDSSISQVDIYTLKSGIGLLNRYNATAIGLEKTAMAGLSMLTETDPARLELAESRIRPQPLPASSLQELQSMALASRPEMKQLNAGINALSALVRAKEAEMRPNLVAGLVGTAGYSPGRDSLDNPYITDPFNQAALSPVLALQWKWQGSRQNAVVAQAEAELEGLMAKGAFAQKGIPFQVAEAWYNVNALNDSQIALYEGARDARRAMTSAYLNFEAGVGEPAKALDALKNYVLMYSDYLLTVNEYNYQLKNLEFLTGQLQ
jgi:outer membrane protein